MRENSTFQTILEQKIKAQSGSQEFSSFSAHSQNQGGSTTSLDPAHLAFLMGSVGRTAQPKPEAQQVKRFYSQSAHSLRTPRPEQVPPTPEQVVVSAPSAEMQKPAPTEAPPHLLSTAQKTAFQFMIKSGALLGPAFTQKELRNAFRRTALRLHPDMNKGTSGPFIELKKHYEELSQLFAA